MRTRASAQSNRALADHLVSVRAVDVTIMAAALLTTALLAGIYPDGHFDTVTKLGKANVDTVIKDTIDSGKTLFVRFIASEG